MESSAPGWEEVEKLLEEEGIEVPRDASGKIAAFTALIGQFGKAMNLVSRGDLEALWSRHVVDSLSLAPWWRTWELVAGFRLWSSKRCCRNKG